MLLYDVLPRHPMGLEWRADLHFGCLQLWTECDLDGQDVNEFYWVVKNINL